MRHKYPLIALAGATLAVVPLLADTLRTRDGKEIDGTFVGATARQVEFLPSAGKALKIPIDQIDAIEFSTPAVIAPKPVAPPAARRAAIVIPAGTTFRVRTIDLIDADVTTTGAKFRAALDDPIMMSGNVVVPRGADAVLVASKVEQGGKMKGSDLVELKVNSIVVGGRSYPVVSSISESKTKGEGKKTAGKVVGGAGLGALIGGIAGGGKGAGIGALIGVAGGTIVAASGEPHLKIPAESRLTFELLSDVKLQ